MASHDELMSNFFAQADALACGKTIQELKEENVPGFLQSKNLYIITLRFLYIYIHTYIFS